MEIYIALCVVGIVSGMLTILFGFAGGFVIIPIVYSTIHLTHTVDSAAYAMAFKSAIATSLLLMVLNSALASYQQYKNNRIQFQYIFPLAYWIALGAIVGTTLSFFISASLLKWIFVIYLLVTIVDCLKRQMFSVHHIVEEQTRTLTSTEKTLGGFLIGSIAAALGVGGSVMTVPLFRRCGLKMLSAVALANPLSIPVAIAGCLTYVFGSILHPIFLGAQFIGYFYLPALICLIVGSFIGMRITKNWGTKFSNTIHERGYIILLMLVLAVILFQ
ncbi:sulfite transporter TauE/SafE [Acinetobacter defluvii]|uniref:sulfite exporter TauE/SafE family protein n=1 Tax=Acinetobacter defluvii TaxID=1871111 RepID=UPI00149022DC|nr:sulfite exporter TauE/SafE family protein [Acinetobacter defluvii]NNP72641.1 sulfite transporter TauE/SafE [Acinetobacter defluvii]